VEDRIDVVQRLLDRAAISHITEHRFDCWVQIARELGKVAVNLLAQVIQDPHVIAPRQQRVGQVGADEPGTAGDQN